MANYQGVTVSEGGKVRSSDIGKAKELIESWSVQGDVTVEIGKKSGEVAVFGYDDFELAEDSEDGYENVTEEELKKLSAFMESPLVIKCVGNEKCRYVAAYAWIVRSNRVDFVDLDAAVLSALNK